MNKYIEKANKCLNNENAGPNLENLIAFGFAIIVASAVFSFGRTIWWYLHVIPFSHDVDKPEYRTVIGYNVK